MRWWSQERNVPNLAQQTSPQWPWYWWAMMAVLIWQNNVVFLPVNFVLWAQLNLAHFLSDLPPPKGNVSALKTVNGYKWGSIVKQKEHASQWYKIQFTSFPNNSRNYVVSKIFRTFCADFISLWFYVILLLAIGPSENTLKRSQACAPKFHIVMA